MGYDLIPGDVEQFILRHIESVAQLEGLLLLRSDPSVGWNAGELSKRLYISEKETTEVLMRLHADGFVVAKTRKPAVYKYEPGTAELRQMVDRVAEIYAKYLVPVTKLIHSKPKTRVQEFADAFKLRKEEEE